MVIATLMPKRTVKTVGVAMVIATLISIWTVKSAGVAMVIATQEAVTINMGAPLITRMSGNSITRQAAERGHSPSRLHGFTAVELLLGDLDDVEQDLRRPIVEEHTD